MKNTAPVGVNLNEGEELVAAAKRLSDQMGISFCDICGFGEVDWIELKGAGEEASLSLNGPFWLLDLKGRIRKAGDICLDDFFCTVSRHTDNGIQVLGGKLIRAGVKSVELSFSELSLPEEIASELSPGPVDSQRVKEDLPKAAPAVNPIAPAAATAVSMDDRWAHAIAESKRMESRGLESDDEVEERPKRGDIVIHRQFGRCTVLRIEDEHITLTKPDGRQVQLGLPILKFTRKDAAGRHTIFEVEVHRQR
jgi:predicted DNA-binding protein with PD1-like motif